MAIVGGGNGGDGGDGNPPGLGGAAGANDVPGDFKIFGDRSFQPGANGQPCPEEPRVEIEVSRVEFAGEHLGGCQDLAHLHSGSGIFIDGVGNEGGGPFADPNPTDCGYGLVAIQALPLLPAGWGAARADGLAGFRVAQRSWPLPAVPPSSVIHH